MRVVSSLYFWCTCTRYGGSSDISWECSNHLLWSCSEYWSSFCCAVFLSAWGRHMIDIFLRHLTLYPLVLLWKYHHTWCWIPEINFQAGLHVVLWLQWKIWYIPWCWTSHTIGCWWVSVDENCKMTLLVHTQWIMGTSFLFVSIWSSW